MVDTLEGPRALRSVLFVLPALLLGCGASPAPVVGDASTEVAADALRSDGSSDLTSDAAPDLAPDALTPDGPDAFLLPPPPTTRKATVRGVLPATALDEANKIQFGLTTSGPGEEWTVRDDLGATQQGGGSVTGQPVSLLFLAHLTDVHIIDEESPLRLVKYDSVVQAAYRMNEMFNTQLLDAMIRTINRLGDAHRPFDAVVFTGDVIDNTQQNELAWFIDTVDGALIDPDSGADDDPLPGPGNDASDPFEAEGLRPDVPWIVVTGNHDQLVQGSVSAIWPNGIPDSVVLSWFPGIAPLIANDDGCLLDCFDFSATPQQQLQMVQSDPRTAIALGSFAEAAVFPTVTPVTASEIGPGNVAPDSARRLLTFNEWVSAFLQSPTSPPGHGMGPANLAAGHGCYVYEPLPGVPIRIIALDTVSRSLPDGSALATLRRDVFDDFVVPQLDQALVDDVLVVLISHHQSWGFPPKGLFTPWPLQASKRDLTGGELVAKVNSYPNVVLHLVGHGHDNEVRAHAAGDGDPLKGYWELETCAASFWPQQARIIEVVDNRDGTGTIYSTMLDADFPAVEVPDWPHRSIAAQGRHYGLYDVQMGFGGSGAGTAADRNVLLHFAIPPAIRAKIDALNVAGQLAGRSVQSTGF